MLLALFSTSLYFGSLTIFAGTFDDRARGGTGFGEEILGHGHGLESWGSSDGIRSCMMLTV